MRFVNDHQLSIQLEQPNEESDEKDMKGVAITRYLTENHIEHDDGHGGYKYWLLGKRYSSTYQLARHFVNSLPKNRTGQQTNTRQSKRVNSDMSDDSKEQRGEEDDNYMPPVPPAPSAFPALPAQGGPECVSTLRAEMARMQTLIDSLQRHIASQRNEQNKRTREDADEESGSVDTLREPQRSQRVRSRLVRTDMEPDVRGDYGLFEEIEAPPPNSFVREVTQQVATMLRLPVIPEITLRDVEELFDRQVMWLGNQVTSLRLLCNFSPDDVMEAFLHRGVTFATAMEQAQKSFLQVALVALSSMKKRPCLLLVGLAQASTQELEGKMRQTLEGLGITTTYLSNAEDGWRKFKDDTTKVSEFLSGHRVLITPSYAMARASVIDELDANDVLLIMDESDVVFARDSWTEGTKEAELALAIGKPHEEEARVTGVVLVSATHIADFHLWKCAMPDVPKVFISVDLDVLRERGFTTHAEMELVHTVKHQDAIADKLHGLITPGFRFLMDDFKSCEGRKKLLLVASCPRVNAGESTLFTQADEVLRLDPDALVVVHYSGNCFFKFRRNGGARAGSGDGVCVQMETHNPVASNSTQRKHKKVKTIGKALKLLQQRYCCTQTSDQPYIDRRFVVVGYNALSRSTSTRTDDMVPTHMFALLGKGRHSADVRQTLMRPAGKSTHVRHHNGHGNVKVVTPEEDWELVTTLYGFQEAIAEEMAQNPDFDFESHQDYAIGADPVINTYRKHTRPHMRLKGNWKVNATQEEQEAYKEERAQKRADRMRRMRLEGQEEENDLRSEVIADVSPYGNREPEYDERIDNGSSARYIDLFKKMARFGPIVNMAQFARSEMVSTSGNRWCERKLRDFGLITRAGVSPVALTAEGIRIARSRHYDLSDSYQ
jgi:hypothetical protein